MSDQPIALVTGGGTGIGATCCRRLAGEGFRVGIHYRSSEEKAKKLAAELDGAFTIRADLMEPETLHALVKELKEVAGRVDVLVNNAGVLRFAMLEQTSLEDFEFVVRVNQLGPFLGMKSSIGAMRRAGGGSIVNISSLAGIQGIGGAVSYTASKFAVRGMTKVAAIELGCDSIRVNSVHPGGVETPMTRPFGTDSKSEDTRAYTSPIARIGRPDEVANLVLWLASDKSSYCTGAEFIVDGGESAGDMPGPLRRMLQGS